MDNLTPWKEALKERTLYGCFVTYGLPDIADKNNSCSAGIL